MPCPILPSRSPQPLQAAIGAPKSACRPPANLPSTQIRARTIAPVTSSPTFRCPRAVHRWIRGNEEASREVVSVNQIKQEIESNSFAAKQKYEGTRRFFDGTVMGIYPSPTGARIEIRVGGEYDYSGETLRYELDRGVDPTWISGLNKGDTLQVDCKIEDVGRRGFEYFSLKNCLIDPPRRSGDSGPFPTVTPAP